MNQEYNFLKAIIDDPNDDTHRLAFADWLDEHSTQRPGDPNYDRAEFIRLQMKIAAHQDEKGNPVPPDKWPKVNNRLACLALDLLDKHGAEWMAPLRALVPDAHFEFRKGFPHHVMLTAEQFLAHGEALVNLAPIRSIKITECETESLITRVAASPALRKLEHLDLGENDMGEAGAAVIARAGELPLLRELELSGNDFGAAGVAAIATSPWLTHLTSLKLSGNDMGDEGARALSSSDRVKNLQTLELRMNGIQDAGLAYIAQSRTLGNLRKINLSMNAIGNAAPLIDTVNLPQLQLVDMSLNHLSHHASMLIVSSLQERRNRQTQK